MKTRQTLILSGLMVSVLSLGLSASIAAHADGPREHCKAETHADGRMGQQGHKGHKRHHAPQERLRHLAGKLEFSEAQNAQLEVLLSSVEERKGDSPERRRGGPFQDLDPASADYMASVNERIEIHLETVRERMQQKASLRKGFFEILTDEQKGRLDSLKAERRHH